jgi:hypothetical protein
MSKSLWILLGVAFLAQNAWAKETQVKRLPAAYVQLDCGSAHCATLPQKAPTSTHYQAAGTIPLNARTDLKSTTIPVQDHLGGQNDFTTVGFAFNF